jgi:hypothetical protein
MNYFCFANIQKHWAARAIYIPWSAMEDPVVAEGIAALKELGTLCGKGHILSTPFEETEDGSQQVTWRHLAREANKRDHQLIGEFAHWADAEYHLYDSALDEPLYFWVPDARWDFGGPASCQHMIDKLNANATVKEFAILTEVPVDEPTLFSLRFFLSPPEASVTLVNELRQLGLSQIQLANTAAYGFCKTESEQLFNQLNKSKLEIQDVGVIVFN